MLRELRRKYPDINLSIHAGEVDEPNYHVRDTLLLGAQRIGHGVNLITDPETLVLMRNGPYMVEINLISNLLLEYVSDYSQHPFPEYLRIGVPVALSTDDRGMWDSNMSDEFYVAVKEFNLSWEEIVKLGRNSLYYSFLDASTKERLLAAYDKRVAAFAEGFSTQGLGCSARREARELRFFVQALSDLPGALSPMAPATCLRHASRRGHFSATRCTRPRRAGSSSFPMP